MTTVVKVSALTELASVDLAAGDLIEIVDISEAVSSDKTKKIQAGNFRLLASGQITDGIVTEPKLAALAVTNGKVAAGAITPDKMSAQVRGMNVKLYGSAEAVAVYNFAYETQWPALMDGWHITSIRASITTPSTSGAVTVVVSKAGGATIATPSIAQGDRVSTPIAVDVAIADTDALSFNVTAAGVGAKGLAVEITATQV